MLGEVLESVGDAFAFLPINLSGWLLLVCYSIFLLSRLLVLRGRGARLSILRWLAILLLAVLGFLLSHPISQLPFLVATGAVPSLISDQQAQVLSLISAVPYLVASLLYGAGPAIIVGFATGMGKALGTTAHLYAPFHYAFAAYLAALMLGQLYQGRLYRWLRFPLVAAVLSQLTLALLAALAVLVNSNGFVVSVDNALTAFVADLPSAVAVGICSGVIVAVLARILSRSSPSRRLVPSPTQRSLRTYLLANYFFFVSLILLLGAAIIFGLSSFVASRALVTEMAASSVASLKELEAFHAELADALTQFGQDEGMSAANKVVAAHKLGRLHASAPNLEEVLLVNNGLSVVSQYPPLEEGWALTPAEQSAARESLDTGLSMTVLGDDPSQKASVSLIAPVRVKNGDQSRVLLGRVNPDTLASILDRAPLPEGSRSVVDRNGRIVISSSDRTLASERFEESKEGSPALFVPAYLGGEAFLIGTERRSPVIYYVSPPTAGGWRMTASIPLDLPLNQAFAATVPILLTILAISGLFYVRFSGFGNRVAEPVKSLAQTSWAIAADVDAKPTVDLARPDEIGELGRAVVQLQRSLYVRSNELKLLLSASQEIAASHNLSESMPAILRAAVRGTGAVAARIIIQNPQANVPLSTGAGPLSDELAVLDRMLMSAMRQNEEQFASSARELRQLFDSFEHALPIKSLASFRLTLRAQFTGIFFLGFTQRRNLSQDELRFLRTLAAQASVMIENMHLYATAEGGRQRLRAILSSTTEAILVTDQSNRIVLLNEAMERTCQISAGEAIGHVCRNVIQSPELTYAIGQARNEYQNLEVVGRDGKDYLANISTIRGHHDLLLGRVAVLHDISGMKKAEKLRAEFVSNVTHDLKTPMTIISGLASTLTLSDDLGAEEKSAARKIVSEVDHMAELVDNLLDLGELDAGTPLQLEKIDATEFLAELVDNHWLHAHQSGIRLRAKVSHQLPPVTADRAWLYQALSNLLTNGFKHAPDSGEMMLSAVLVDNHVIFSVHDHGPGVPEADQAHLFDRFYRGSGKKKKRAKGNGLGLAIVKGVSERHGGQAWCQSSVGEGSTFSISIPVEPPSSLERSQNS